MIRETCRMVIHADGITADECDAAAEFLIHRKDRVLEKIRASRARLSNVRQWRLDED